MSTPPEENADLQAPAQGTKGKERKKIRKARERIAAENASLSRDDSNEERLENIRHHLAFLCHDMRTFSGNAAAADRLNSSVHAHFLGPPYLSAEDAAFVVSCPVSALRGTHENSASNPTPSDRLGLGPFLDKGMAALMAARRAKAQDGRAERDFVLCTSHDLAPLLQEACGLPKQHFETRAFKEAYRRWEKEARKAAKRTAGSA